MATFYGVRVCSESGPCLGLGGLVTPKLHTLSHSLFTDELLYDPEF
jgi:hypothetical protein